MAEKDEEMLSKASSGDENNEELDESFTKPHKLQKKWKNRERILILCSRGVSFRDRHLMNDLKALMPHSKSDSKVNKKERLTFLNEVAEMKNCTKCVYFEARKGKDLYIWFSNVEKGPSAKFLVQNIHTSGELKLSGNCLKSSRPILSFEKSFDDNPQNQLLKELFTQIFATPNFHPKSQPFVDHVLNFSVEDKRIWFRNYQIVDEATAKLEEIGPRMVLQLIKIFEGSFGGAVLYENPDYVCPNTIRRQKKLMNANKYIDKVHAKLSLHERRDTEPDTYATDPVFEAVYDDKPSSKAVASISKTGTLTSPSVVDGELTSDNAKNNAAEFRKLKRKLNSSKKRNKSKSQAKKRKMDDAAKS